MYQLTKRLFSLLLVLTLVTSMFSQVAMAKNNKKNQSGDQIENFQEVELTSEKGLYETDEIASIYDEAAIIELKELVETTTSSALTVSLTNEELSSDDYADSLESIHNIQDVTLLDLIEEYETKVEEDYIYGMFLTDTGIMDIKHKITIYLHEILRSNELSEDKKVLIEDIIINFEMSNAIVCKNAIIGLNNIVGGIANKGTKKNVEAKVKNAVNHYSKASEFKEKELIIPEMKSYENSYRELLKGYEKAGYTLNQDFFDADIDTDGDTITDGFELLARMNPLNSDTDHDGLKDNIELETYPYCDPLLKDTDGNGILDLYEDIDGDGLTNEEELIYNTSLLGKDSDVDGLTDGFEVNEFNTLPDVYDTDDDGLSDGDEYELGTNPNNPDTDNDGIIDSDEIYEQSISKEINVSEKPEVTSVSVSFGANENIKRTTTIRSLYGIDMRASSVVGLVGSPMSIETSSEFEQATITFNYNEDELGDTNEDDLGILWYNEEDGEFVLLDPYLDTTNNRVSVDTNHFSTYMVVDKAKWHELWARELDYSRNTSTPGIPTQYYDIVFAIDSSGSMLSNDPSGLRKEAAKQFVDAFYSEDQGAVVDFDSYAYIKVHLTQDKDAIKSAIDTINSSGGTNIDKAVNTSIDELLSSYANEENKKIIILLTDGSGTYYNNTTQRAIDNDITIYTVGLGYGVNSSLLDSIATSTGGQFYQAAESDELRDIFFGIEDETIGDGEIDTTDTDGDGLYDTYEIVGMKTPYGIVYSDPLLKDSDGDGLGDGEEMGSFSVTVSGGEIAYKGFYPLSLPDRKDSDGDGIEDNIDPRCMQGNINDIFIDYIGKLEQLAGNYNEGKSEEFNDFSVGKSKWLVFMFIRQINGYSTGRWPDVAGAIDDNFVEYVKGQDIDLYNYFITTPTINGSDSGQLLDLYHWGATSCVYIYTSDFDDGFKAGGISEKHLDNLGGWAGDLQTLIIDIKNNEYNGGKYDDFYDNINKYIGHNKYSFSEKDLLADVDAQNIFHMIDDMTIKDALLEYYESNKKSEEYNYGQRFTMFTQGFKDKDAFSDLVYTYTKNKYFVFKWPLYKNAEVDVTKNQSKAARDSFTDYIWDLVDKE